MICLLGSVGSRCEGLDVANNCTVMHPNAVQNNMHRKGSCVYKDARAPKVGIYLPANVKAKNSIKASKGK